MHSINNTYSWVKYPLIALAMPLAVNAAVKAVWNKASVSKLSFLVEAAVGLLVLKTLSPQKCFLLSAGYTASKILYGYLSHKSAKPPSLYEKTSRVIKLNNKYLRSLPPEIYHLTNLQELDLSSTALTHLPDTIGNLTNLQWLNINANQIINLPDTIGNLTNLQVLYIHVNQIITLPEAIGNLTNLRVLTIRYNKLITLPAEIGNLTNLQWLGINYNKLTTLPAEIGNLTNLRRLNISYNKLTTLPAEIGNLTNLERLYINNNDLTTLPDSLASLPRACTIYADQLRLSSEEIARFENLIHEQRARDSAVGPQLIVSTYAGPRTALTKPLNDFISDWLQEYKTLFSNAPKIQLDQSTLTADQADLLRSFLDKLKTTRDYTAGGLSQKNTVRRVKEMLEFTAQNSKFCENLFTILADASATCEDRAIRSLDDIEIQIYLSQTTTLVNRAEIIIGVERRDLLKKEIEVRITKQAVVDPIEVYLYYEILCKDKLKLPTSTLSMVHIHCVAWVTPEMVEEDSNRVLEKTTEQKDLVNILMSYRAWKKHVDSESEKIQKAKDKFSEEADKLFDGKQEEKDDTFVQENNRMMAQRSDTIAQLQRQYTEQWMQDHYQELQLFLP